MSAWHSYKYLSIDICSAPCARLSVPIVFRWSLTFIGCFDPGPWHPLHGESIVVANPLYDELWLGTTCPVHLSLTSMMPPTPVFLLLFLMLFLKVHHVSSFHTDWAGNSTDLYKKQPNASSSIFEYCHEVILKDFLLCAASHFSHRSYRSIANSKSSTNCFETNVYTTSGPRLVSTMLGWIIFLSRSTESSPSCPVSSNDVCLATFGSAVDSQCLKNCICLCFVSDGRFLFFSISSISTNSWWALSCRHVYFPWFTASCHHDRICNIWSLSFHTPYSLGLHFSPLLQVCKGWDCVIYWPL